MAEMPQTRLEAILYVLGMDNTLSAEWGYDDSGRTDAALRLLGVTDEDMREALELERRLFAPVLGPDTEPLARARATFEEMGREWREWLERNR